MCIYSKPNAKLLQVLLVFGYTWSSKVPKSWTSPNMQGLNALNMSTLEIQSLLCPWSGPREVT